VERATTTDEGLFFLTADAAARDWALVAAGTGAVSKVIKVTRASVQDQQQSVHVIV